VAWDHLASENPYSWIGLTGAPVQKAAGQLSSGANDVSICKSLQLSARAYSSQAQPQGQKRGQKGPPYTA